MLHRQDIAQDEFDGKSLAYVLGAGTPGTNKLHIGFTHCFCKKYLLTLMGFKYVVIRPFVRNMVSKIRDYFLLHIHKQLGPKKPLKTYYLPI